MHTSAPTISGNVDKFMEKLLHEKKVARSFQERKHEDWNENYELYRNKVRTNRLTQRQAVNIPLMKETIKTILSKIDDPPIVEWREKSGDELKEIIYQEIWNDNFREEKFEWKDVLDKKNVLLYGLSTKFLNINEDGIPVEVLDTYDVVYDPLMKTEDVESARFIVRQNIFRTLREILADDRYTPEGKEKLRIWITTERGMVQTSSNKEEYEKKSERLISMGVEENEFATFAGGDVIVNLTEHYTKVWSAKKKDFEKRVIVYADDEIRLMDESLKDLIGVDFWPFVLWVEDPETNDVYPDGVADLVRTPNKVLNIWFSQMVENRTLRNFQMHWYDATIQGYTPQTYEPGPGRMLPAPGDPSKTILPVDIQGLDETMNAINFLTQIIERATGATAIEKGVGEKGNQTLGEVQVLVGKATERAVAMAKFYRSSWYELAKKWDELMQANPPKKFTLYKTGRSGKMYEKVVYPSDWQSEAGYEPIVSSSSEQETDQVKSVQKFMFILSQFPNNPALRRIAQKRMLETVDLSPDELKEVQDAEEPKQEELFSQPLVGQNNQVSQQQVAPENNQDEEAALGSLQTRIKELQALTT